MALRGLRICVLRVQNHFSGYRRTAMQGAQQKHTVPTDSVYSMCQARRSLTKAALCLSCACVYTRSHAHGSFQNQYCSHSRQRSVVHVADSIAGWLGINSHMKNKCITNGTFMLGFNALLSLYFKNNLAKKVYSVITYSSM